MKLKNVTLVLFIFLVLFGINQAFAWKITPELQKETNDKLAAVKENYYYPHPHFDLAITYAYTNKIKEGWDELKKVNDLDSEFAPICLRMYINKVDENPNDWKLRFRLAFAYYFNNKKLEALTELKEVLKIDPKNVFAYGYIALIYGEMGKIDIAMENVRKGLAIDSNVAALHALLADGYNKKGDSMRGLSEMVEALRLKALGY